MSQADQRSKNLAAFAAAAVEFEAESGYPAAVMIAMWAQESGWGRAMSGENNCFGITYRPFHRHGYKMCPTSEVLTEADIVGLDPDERATITAKEPEGRKFRIQLHRKFANFPSLLDCIREKYRILTTSPRFRSCVAAALVSKRQSDLIKCIAGGGWATDPGYAKSLTAISRQRNVLNAIEKANREQLQPA